jgi:hypothetical protein
VRPASVEVEVRPSWPYRLPRGGGGDGVMRVRRGLISRFLHVDGDPVVVRAWQRRDGRVVLRADAPCEGVARQRLELAIERVRFAL